METDGVRMPHQGAPFHPLNLVFSASILFVLVLY